MSAQHLTVSSSEGHHLHMKHSVTFYSTKLSANSGTDFPKGFGKMDEKIPDSSSGKWDFLEKINQAAELGPTAI